MQLPRYHFSPSHLGIIGVLLMLSGNAATVAAPLPEATGSGGQKIGLKTAPIDPANEQSQPKPVVLGTSTPKPLGFSTKLPDVKQPLSLPPWAREDFQPVEPLSDLLSTVRSMSYGHELDEETVNPPATDIPESNPNIPIPPIAQPSDETSPDWSAQNFEGVSPSQLTSVYQLSDVKSTDWAFQALQILVERYGVIVGYPDASYRGDRPLTRYEFAAGIRATLDRVNELMAEGLGDQVLYQDLEIIQRLQEDFSNELSQLNARVDSLELQTAELEANQFSTTTKLFGQVIFALSGISGDVADGSGQDLDTNVAFSNRIRVAFLTSFTGEDLLVTLLQSGTNPFYGGITDTPQTTLSFPQDTDNDIVLNRVEYTFPIGDRGIGYIVPTGGNFEYFIPIFNDILNSSGTGTLSAFGFYNPNYFLSGDAGGGIVYDISDAVGLSFGYLAGGASDPAIGVTGGTYGALTQLRLSPTPNIDFGLTYIRSFDALNFPLVGTKNSNQPFGDGIAPSANSYGFQSNMQINQKFELGGWVGLTQARATEGPNDGADADILNWAVTLAFPDLFAEGNLGAIIVGEQPRVINNDLSEFEDSDMSLHIETLYRHQVNDNISITPGFILTTNPNGNADNDSIFLGVVRTTFQF
ncbi:MAG: iron uptake porin [Leptolyngbyaceae cyanobacterium MO_188.B28]|nr:iron uptake porin [Leptolyngbyaceae cyanobacterium MO_188.B28]